MATELPGLRVRISAEISQFKRDMGDVTQRIRAVAKVAAVTIKAIAAVGAAASAAATGFGLFVKAGMDSIDAQAKLARQLDGTIGGLRGVQQAASDAGVATNDINSAVAKLNVALGNAQIYGAEAGKALKALGLDASELTGMDVDRRMATIADRIKDMGLSGAQAGILLRQLGVEQTSVINLMRQGGDAIREARQEIEDYGLAISQVDAATIEAANDALSRVGLVVESVRSALAVELAPIVLEIAARFNEAARQAGGWGGVVSEVTQDAVSRIAGVVNAVNKVRAVFKAAEAFTKGWGVVVATTTKFALDNVVAFIDLIVAGVNQAILALNKLPKVDLDLVTPFSQSDLITGINQGYDDLVSSQKEAQAEFQRLWNSDADQWVTDFFDSVERRKAAIAEGIDGTDFGLLDLPEFGDIGDGGGGISDAEKLREQMAQRLQVIRESLMTERELEIEHHAQRMEELAKIRELELVTEDEYRVLREEAEARHLQRLTDMEQKAANERARIESDLARTMVSMRERAIGESINLLNMFAGKSKAAAIAAIALEKGVAIARVVMDTQAAMWKARATLGPGVGDAVAAKYAALGTASVGLIAAQGIAQAASALSGGGASSIGSGAPAGGGGSANQPAMTQQQAPTMSGTLTVEGVSPNSLFTGDAVRQLADQLLDYQRSGGRVVWA